MSRTVVNLNDDLVRKAGKFTGLKKKVEIVNKALEEFVKHFEVQKSIMEMEGRIEWQGDLKQMRRDRKIDFSR